MNLRRYEQLIQTLNTFPKENYGVQSRVHPLQSFHFPNLKCYVKRDDELGFGISGSKIRKYSTLIAYLLNRTIEEVVVIGSAYSNHVVGLIQLLIENNIKATLFLRGDPNRLKQGNALFIELFVSSDSIHWFSKDEWSEVESHAYHYAKNQRKRIFVLPEGGFCDEAFPGALTLSLDIIRNEQEMTLQFNHIFLEVGTGLTACALILALHWLEHPCTIHCLLLAEDQNAFLNRLNTCKKMFQDCLQQEISFPENFKTHLPQKTKGFGKVPKFIFSSIRQIAQKEGFLTDPIYSAKLFVEAENILALDQYKGNALMLHSGGALTLMGFQTFI